MKYKMFVVGAVCFFTLQFLSVNLRAGINSDVNNSTTVKANNLTHGYIESIKSSKGEKKDWEITYTHREKGAKNHTQSFTVSYNRTGAESTSNLQIKFKKSELPLFNNWKLIDAGSNTLIKTFDKNSDSFIDAGAFKPGDKKLFIISSVMETGGTLAGDELIQDTTVNVDSTIWNNGYNLTIRRANLLFLTGTSIIMHKGTLRMDRGEESSDLEHNYLMGQTHETAVRDKWFGIKTDSTYIFISMTTIYDVEKKSALTSPQNNRSHTLYITNPPSLEISGSIIDPPTTDSSAGGILVIYTSYAIASPSLNISGNEIYVHTYQYGVDVESYLELAGDYTISNNHIESTIGASAGIILVGLQGVTVSGNIVLNWSFGLYTIYSEVELYSNYFHSTVSYYCLSGESSSTFDMNNNSFNTFSINGGDIIWLVSAYFDADNGENAFRKMDTTSGYFFHGKFHQNGYSSTQYARSNCFYTYTGSNWIEIDTSEVQNNVTLYNLTPVTFLYFNNCSSPAPAMQNQQADNILQPVNNQQTVVDAARNLYDEAAIDMKNKKYSSAGEKYRRILASGVENLQSVNAVKKLLAAAVLSDRENNTSFASGLKSYFQSYIQNHPMNKDIINEMNFCLIKCKALTGDYQGGLDGLKSIMMANSGNSYGRYAKWEYEALKMYVASLNGSYETNLAARENFVAMVQRDIHDGLYNGGNTESLSRDHSPIAVANDFKLNQNYPNPFNPVTNIKFSLPKEGFVTIKVYDVLGKMVKELVSEFKETGNHSISFDGSGFASGIYFYRLESQNFTDTKRMVLVK